MNYFLGVFNQVQDRIDSGFDIVFSSTVPIGAGLSSSAALECGFLFGLNHFFNLDLTKEQIAKMGQKAEHTFAGVNCGIMDQFASVFGKENHVIFLDCDTLDINTLLRILESTPYFYSHQCKTQFTNIRI